MLNNGYKKMKIVIILPNREEFVACEVIKGLHRRGVELIPSSPLSNLRNAYKVGYEDIPDIRDNHWKQAGIAYKTP